MRNLLNFGWLSVEQVVRLVLALLVMTMLARHLGPAEFGAYAYVFSLTALFMPLAHFGLELIVMRRSVDDRERTNEMLASALLVRLIGALAGALLAVGTVAAIGGPATVTPALVALAATTLVFAPGDTFNAWLKANERMAWVALPRTAVAVFVFGVTALLVWRGADLGAMIAMRAAEAALFALSAFLAYRFVHGTIRHLRPTVALVATLAREGWPLLLASIAVAIYLRIDQVMLGQMVPDEELGRYGVAARILEAALLVPATIQAAFYASLVRAHMETPARFEDHMQRLYDTMALAAFGVMLGLGFGALLFFEPIFGDAYDGAQEMLLILLLSLPFFYLAVGWGAMVTIRKWLWTAPTCAAVGAVVNIGGNLILIPRFGALGAAAATVASFWIAAHGMSFVLPWLRPASRRMSRALNPAGSTIRLLRIYRGDSA